MRKFMFILLFLALATPRLIAGEKFKFEPVGQHDWEIAQDSSKKIRVALMIFEKVWSDESALDDKECYLRTYRRIKIFNAQGKTWADVNIPYNPKNQKIKEVYGRTILPDGRIIELTKEKILEKQIVKTDEEELRQMFFSLPGVTDSCIVEYYYAYENEHNNSKWLAQKDIYLMNGEYHWKFFRPTVSGLQSLMMFLYSLGFSPNYLLLNTTNHLGVDMIPNADKPEEAIFRLNDLLPYRSEPYCLPDEAAKAQLVLYYSDGGNANMYWSVMALRSGEELKEWWSNAGDANPLIKEFSQMPTRKEKIAAAYRWLQEHIKNVSYEEKEGKYDENENVNDVLSHKYGTQADINYCFQYFLKQLDFKSRLFYVARRDRWLFHMIAKFWQFDRPVVGVIDSSGGITYYSPGDAHTSQGRIPWYYEGTSGLVVGAGLGEQLFVDVPKSPLSENTRNCDVRLRLAPDEDLTGTVKEEFTGHEARKVRLLLGEKPAAEQKNILKKDIEERVSTDWKDSIVVSGVERNSDSLSYGYLLHGPALEADAAGRFIFHPYALFSDRKNPFVAEIRENPLMFEYAATVTHRFILTLDKGLRVDVLPPPLMFSNKVGEVVVKVTQSGGSVEISSRYVLKSPFYSPNLYAEAKALFQQRIGLKDFAVVLKKGK